LVKLRGPSESHFNSNWPIKYIYLLGIYWTVIILQINNTLSLLNNISESSEDLSWPISTQYGRALQKIK
jgi:hypothetical protein